MHVDSKVCAVGLCNKSNSADQFSTWTLVSQVPTQMVVYDKAVSFLLLHTTSTNAAVACL